MRIGPIHPRTYGVYDDVMVYLGDVLTPGSIQAARAATMRKQFLEAGLPLIATHARVVVPGRCSAVTPVGRVGFSKWCRRQFSNAEPFDMSSILARAVRLSVSYHITNLASIQNSNLHRYL